MRPGLNIKNLTAAPGSLWSLHRFGGKVHTQKGEKVFYMKKLVCIFILYVYSMTAARP
ncbi:hypothetical protein BRYFOR_09751 [Marvinbryantia formatexigens DSM 14469]|uniref:Uncharacterized protein n=1 Tax=Marvinbryantia formatexigens DSM 14469 TaxID=478749 RepID=C6LM52_9FIRM|nr:hypothetical protein BRYFOR_09751 [Marvinbryantia formatexigens DSM 14469]